MDNRYILGKIFEHVGKELQNKNSQLCKSFVLSNEQLEACIRLLKVLSSPQTHILMVEDVAFRYGVTERTVRNCVHKQVIPSARRLPGGNTPYWLSHEMGDVDNTLVRYGIVRRKDIRKIDFRMRDLLNNFW